MWIVLFVACLISTGVHADDNARAPTISSEGATLRLYVYTSTYSYSADLSS